MIQTIFGVVITVVMISCIWLSYVFPGFARKIRKSKGPWSSNFNSDFKRHVYISDTLSTIGFGIAVPSLFMLGGNHQYTLPFVGLGLMFLIPGALLSDWIDKQHS